jgi:ribonuclease HI
MPTITISTKAHDALKTVKNKLKEKAEHHTHSDAILDMMNEWKDGNENDVEKKNILPLW